MFKIRGSSCYDVNVTYIQSRKDGRLKSFKFAFRVSFQFLLYLKKKIVKFLVKIWRPFEIMLLIKTIM